MFKGLIGSLGAVLLLVACGDAPTAPATSDADVQTAQALDNRSALPTIAGIASADDNFSILVAALDAAGLVDTFNGNRQYTVFAPTNDAFVALLGDLNLTADQLLADTGLLTSVLLYHVARGNRNSTAVLRAGQVRMLNGQFAPTWVQGGIPYIDGAQIIAADIRASNGTVHVIDTVLLP